MGYNSYSTRRARRVMGGILARHATEDERGAQYIDPEPIREGC